ncbi:MAG: 6,7-dimethyl-8-ribityllumazine synthase, partial [Acidiferrobacterales bacterium]
MSSIKNIEGDLVVRGARFGIVLTRFNSFIVDRLLEGAVDALERHGAESDA